MRLALAFIAGALTGLVTSVPIRRALIRYSEASLPQPEHKGPKYYFNGRPTPTPEGFNR